MQQHNMYSSEVSIFHHFRTRKYFHTRLTDDDNSDSPYQSTPVVRSDPSSRIKSIFPASSSSFLLIHYLSSPFMNRISLRPTTLSITLLVVLVAIIFSPSNYNIAAASRSIAQRLFTSLTSKMSSTKTPVYFLSHGGVCPRSLQYPPHYHLRKTHC